MKLPLLLGLVLALLMCLELTSAIRPAAFFPRFRDTTRAKKVVPVAPTPMSDIDIEDIDVDHVYQGKLTIARRAIKDKMDEGVDGIVLQKFTTDTLTTLLVEIITEAEDYMKNDFADPPCKFSFVQGGSGSRIEMSPFSDIDIILMIETMNTANYNYFIEYGRKMVELMRKFGESERSCKGKHEATKSTTAGFRICPALNPLYTVFDKKPPTIKMTNTPAGFAALFDPSKIPPDEVSDGLFFLRSIHGDAGVLDDYRHLIATKFAEMKDDPFMYRKVQVSVAASKAVAVIGEVIQKKDTWNAQAAAAGTATSMEVKTNFYRPLQMLVRGLYHYHQLPLAVSNTAAQADALEAAHFLSASLRDDIKAALKIIALLRTKIHLLKSDEHEKFFYKTPDANPDHEYVLSGGEKTAITNAAKTIECMKKMAVSWLKHPDDSPFATCKCNNGVPTVVNNNAAYVDSNQCTMCMKISNEWLNKRHATPYCNSLGAATNACKTLKTAMKKIIGSNSAFARSPAKLLAYDTQKQTSKNPSLICIEMGYCVWRVDTALV